MTSRFPFVLISLAFLAQLAACEGDAAFTPPPGPGPGQPSPGTMTADGIWVGQAVTPDVPDIVTGFEFNDPSGFSLGTAPFTAEFQGGMTELAGSPDLRTDGSFSWRIGLADGSVTFPVPGDSLSFFARTVFSGNIATTRVLDEFGVELSSIAVTNTFQQISVNRNPGQSRIASVVITVAAGQIVIDSFSFGFESTASNDDIACLFAPEPNDSFACIVSDASSGAVIASAEGSYTDTGDEISGAGRLYAAPGETLPDGSTVAEMTIGDGPFEAGDSLNMTFDSLGLSIRVSTLFDAIYARGAALAAVAANYASFDVFGDPSSFVIDSTGQISAQSASGCILNGQVAVIDPDANVYDVNLIANAATCGALGGDYDGLGMTEDDMATNDTFVFAVFVDGERMIVGEAVK